MKCIFVLQIIHHANFPPFALSRTSYTYAGRNHSSASWQLVHLLICPPDPKQVRDSKPREVSLKSFDATAGHISRATHVCYASGSI